MAGTYGAEIGGLGVSLNQELERADVWKEECHPGCMDQSYVYHPEEDGWTLVRVKKGMSAVQIENCNHYP